MSSWRPFPIRGPPPQSWRPCQAMQRRILIVEDDARVAASLTECLQDRGYATSLVMNGLHVVPEVRRAPPALVLMDVGLPGCDGIAVCRSLREFSAVPVILLSGSDDEPDRATGLEAGADDYVGKPFGEREIAARVEANLRRVEGRVTGMGQFGFHVDDAGRRIGCDGRWLPLTPSEYTLLRRFVQRPGQVFTRDELAGASPEDRESARTIDSHVKNLRRKLAQVRPQASPIESVYGLG